MAQGLFRLFEEIPVRLEDHCETRHLRHCNADFGHPQYRNYGDGGIWQLTREDSFPAN
jgi:hypothetical protein